MCERQASRRYAQARADKKLKAEKSTIATMRLAHPHAFAKIRGHKAQYHKAAELWCAALSVQSTLSPLPEAG